MPALFVHTILKTQTRHIIFLLIESWHIRNTQICISRQFDMLGLQVSTSSSYTFAELTGLKLNATI
jgi:hypothetical protein